MSPAFPSIQPKLTGRWHPFLRALKAIRSGSLELHLPGGQQHIYRAAKQGPQAYLKFHDWRCLDRLINQGDLGWGEDYMMGLWETRDLPTLMHFAAENFDALESFSNGNILFRLWRRMHRAVNNNQPPRSLENVQKHYDLGNDFYRLWLDEGMTYSCALFNGDSHLSLEAAQKAKYERILSRLAPRAGDRILEIGCGWGGFMEVAATRGYDVTGITLSKEQHDFSKQRLTNAALGNLTDVRLQDYRDIKGKFDHIVSIGMFEHVGENFWGSYMNTLSGHLKRNGTALIQTIVIRDDLFDFHRAGTGFIREHIFPGGLLPTSKRFEREALKAGLVPLDTFFFGKDYAITLQKWRERFDARVQDIRALGYDEAFIRKWRFYLAYCAAMFRTGHINVMQAHLGHRDVKPSGDIYGYGFPFF
jgi:cyclopropane-fatty-acyl-phospholipid synthase